MELEVETIVIDNGSTAIRAGIAGDDLPSHFVPPVIGTSRVCNERGLIEKYFGQEAIDRNDQYDDLDLNWVIHQGIVTDWKALEELYRYIFTKMGKSPGILILSEPCLNPKVNREKMMELAFDGICVSAFFTAIASALSLFSSGRTSGVVLDIGEEVTHSVVIYEGFHLPHSVKRLDLGGKQLTQYLSKILEERGFSFEFHTVKEFKEKSCRVSEDWINDSTIHTIVDYPLQHSECFSVPEALFQPLLLGLEADGIHRLVFDSVMQCDQDHHLISFRNILLTGGSSGFPGLAKRVEKEIQLLLLEKYYTPQVFQSNLVGAWVGGSIIGSLCCYNKRDITLDDYLDHGTRFIHWWFF